MNFLIVIMASGIARGHVRTTTTATESHKMAAILQIIGWLVYCLLFTSLILDIQVMINWHLSKQGICWPVSHDHIAGSSVQLIEVLKLTADQVLVFDWIPGSCHVRLTCWKPGRIVWKPVNASPKLKFIRIITFSCIQIFFAALFWVYSDYKRRTVNRNLTAKLQNSKQHKWFYLFLGELNWALNNLVKELHF